MDSDHYLFACVRYIEMNPVRAGIVTCAALYPWSSHNCLAHGAKSDAVDPHAACLALGPTAQARQEAYRRLFEVNEEARVIAAIRESISNGFALGSDAFLRRVSVETGLRTRPARRGRPKKSGTVPN